MTLAGVFIDEYAILYAAKIKLLQSIKLIITHKET